MNITTRPVGTNLEEVAVDGQAAGRIYTRANGLVSPYDTRGTAIAPDAALHRDEAIGLVAGLVRTGGRVAPEQVAPVDYDGWLALLAPEGQGPGLYRITRTLPSKENGHLVGCEDCGKTNRDIDQPYYRWVELHDSGYPLELGICQACLTTQAAQGMPHDQPIDPDGARCHFFEPTSAADRWRAKNRH